MITRILGVIGVVLAVSGCATLTKPGAIFYRTGQERKLAGATALLQQGKTSTAIEVLTAICAEPGVPGVTDEALFRLSLLRLGAVQEKNGVAQAQRDLERLGKEYTSSSWAPLATILYDQLESADDLRQQIRKLRELNLSLTKENKEMRQSIEQLKSLELELGKGTKR